MKKSNVLPTVAAIMIAAGLLSACERLPGKLRKAARETTNAMVAHAENAPVEKLNAYTDGYNKLVGSFGLTETRKAYFDKNIPAKSVSDDIFISAGWIHQALDPLKRGRAVNVDGMTELDQSADQLIAALGKLDSLLMEIEPYYKAKAYKEDNLAKGKMQDPILRSSLDAGVSALQKFEVALNVQAKKRDDALLARFKSDGNMTHYHLKLGARQAEELIGLFKNEEDLRSAEKFKQADALVVELEKTVEEQRKLHARLEKSANQMNHSSVTERLTELIGAYRQLKISRKANDFNSMVHKYNGAVGALNAIPIPG